MCVEFAVSVKQPRIPLAEFARRHAGLAVKDGGKIEFVRESHIERDLADGKKYYNSIVEQYKKLK